MYFLRLLDRFSSIFWLLDRQSTAFATMQLKAILYHLLQTFIIDQCEETQDPLKLQRGVNYLTCEDGCWFGLRRRSV